MVAISVFIILKIVPQENDPFFSFQPIRQTLTKFVKIFFEGIKRSTTNLWIWFIRHSLFHTHPLVNLHSVLTEISRFLLWTDRAAVPTNSKNLENKCELFSLWSMPILLNKLFQWQKERSHQELWLAGNTNMTKIFLSHFGTTVWF